MVLGGGRFLMSEVPCTQVARRAHYALIAHPVMTGPQRERELFTDNLLVRIHFIIVMVRWSGLAPWQFEFPFPGSLRSTFLDRTAISSLYSIEREREREDEKVKATLFKRA